MKITLTMLDHLDLNQSYSADATTRELRVLNLILTQFLPDSPLKEVLMIRFNSEAMDKIRTKRLREE